MLDMSSSVVQACFMVHVRFEIYQGLLNRPSLRVSYRDFIPPFLALPADDAAWNNRIVWICGRILQWVQTSSRSFSEWEILKDTVDEWELQRPSGFDAFFYRDANASEGNHFPELWFPGICHGELDSPYPGQPR
jgi:hypothetical protein